MKDGLKVIDCELHLMEPFDLWDKNLEEPYRSRTKITPPKQDGQLPKRLASNFEVEIDGKHKPPKDGGLEARQAARAYGAQRILAQAALHCSPDIYIEGLDAEGIDVAVLSPTFTMALIRYDGLDPRHSAAVCRVYNDWAAEFTRSNPERFKFWGFLPPHDAKLAAKEARRCLRELGAIGVAILQGAIDGHLFSDEFFEPLWEEVNDLRAPLGLHISFSGQTKDDLRGRYAGHRRTELITNTLGLGSFFAHTAVAELIMGGVLERYPNLQPILMESCVSWLPWLLWRMDEKWEIFGQDAGYDLSLKPSEYFRRQCWAVMDCEEDVARYTIDFGGDDNLLVSTDFPHHDSPFPNGIQTFMDLPSLSRETKRKILWDNGARLLGVREPASVAVVA